MKTFAVCTLGCRVNQYDAEAMCEQLLARGFVRRAFSERADVYLVCTCTVTGTSDNKSRQMIARAHRANPDALIVVAGCLAQREGEALLALDGVGLVIGSANRAQAGALIEQALSGVKKSVVEPFAQAAAYEPLQIGHMYGRTRAGLKIQEGCDRNCAYCIIPSVRGPIRSRSVEETVDEAARLAQNGVPEIVLTGIHLTSYGRDLQRQAYPGQLLADVLERIDAIDGVKRIRLGSLEPSILSDAFLSRVTKLEKFACQMHVALQSGSESVLRRMGRSYTRDGYARGVALLRKYWPDVALSTDLIAGFPGETQQEAQETLDFVRQTAFARLHVFPYSVREGTRAAAMPDQLPAAEKHARANALIALGQTLRQAYIARFDGCSAQVLFERRRGGRWEGRTGHDIEVYSDRPQRTDCLTACRLCVRDDGVYAQNV